MRAPGPLTPNEQERLWRWERMMIRFHVVAMPVLVVCAAAVLVWSDSAWVRRSLLGLVIAVLAAATVLQVREKCPRCGARLRTRMLLRLPDRCGYCGVAFERPAGG